MSNIVSVLVPSRKRFDLLLKSLKSLVGKAKDPNRVEILIKFDSDDTESIERIHEINAITTNYKVLIYERRNGYASFHEFINDLCAISSGEFLFLWNDDAIMMTYHWEERLELYENQLCVIQIDNNHGTYVFPFIHRKIYEVLGYFSYNAHCDAWVHYVAVLAGIQVVENEIYAIHDRGDITGNNIDETYLEGCNFEKGYESTMKKLHSTKENELRCVDARKLLDYLDTSEDIEFTVNPTLLSTLPNFEEVPEDDN